MGLPHELASLQAELDRLTLKIEALQAKNHELERRAVQIRDSLDLILARPRPAWFHVRRTLSQIKGEM